MRPTVHIPRIHVDVFQKKRKKRKSKGTKRSKSRSKGRTKPTAKSSGQNTTTEADGRPRSINALSKSYDQFSLSSAVPKSEKIAKLEAPKQERPVNAKEEMIRKGLTRKKTEYPTMEDIASDWDSMGGHSEGKGKDKENGKKPNAEDGKKKAEVGKKVDGSAKKEGGKKAGEAAKKTPDNGKNVAVSQKTAKARAKKADKNVPVPAKDQKAK